MKSEIRSLKNSEYLKGCVLGYGHFTTIHPGHIRYLQHAKDQGDTLVVALIGDNDQHSTYPFNQNERANALSLLGIADVIVNLNGDDLHEAISILEPSILVLGTEFQQDDNLQSSRDLIKKQGGNVQFHAGDVKYANVDLLGSSEGLVKERRRQMYRKHVIGKVLM